MINPALRLGLYVLGLMLALAFPAFAQDAECVSVSAATEIATKNGWFVIGEVPTADGGSAFLFADAAGTFAARIIDGCVMTGEGTLVGPPPVVTPDVKA